ncbi:MAG: dTDP-4-dehydro-6-deoxyglucose aminotransferase [Chitinivibrionales bacterium]|nr:dTDP-4-dehydro-6-deoxyglucose aminotransferase [Chitinivibrionales bacterium]
MKNLTWALLGGKPAFNEMLHVGSPNIGDEEKLIERIRLSLRERRLTNKGPRVQELEEKLRDRLGVRHVILMSNGTTALEIAIRSTGLTGEVIVPSMTFIATAHALQWQQIKPVFADVNPGTLTINPLSVEKLITPRTTGIIGVHLWGRSCDTDALESIAARHRLKLLFDAAHAFDVEGTGGKMIGSFGDAEVFSFHATKFFNTFEGGAVATNNDVLARKIRLMQNFGFAGEDSVIYIGVNGKMNEVCASMGLTSLESIDTFEACNRRNYHSYQLEFSRIPGISLIEHSVDKKTNYQYITVRVKESEFGLSRNQLMRLLQAENIRVRRYFYPGCHKMEPYRSLYRVSPGSLPITENALDEVLTFPTGTAIDQGIIQKIGELVETAYIQSESLKSQLLKNEPQSISDDMTEENNVSRQTSLAFTPLGTH